MGWSQRMWVAAGWPPGRERRRAGTGHRGYQGKVISGLGTATALPCWAVVPARHCIRKLL
jgi:hypothetical protein